MKKLLLLLFVTGIVASAYSQGYKAKETINGVDISYMIVNTGASDDTPAELRLKFKNNNSYAVNITYQVGYGKVSRTSDDYDSEGEDIFICISKNAVKMGKIDGLIVEIPQEEAKMMTTGKSEWGFIKFDVVQIDKCNK